MEKYVNLTFGLKNNKINATMNGLITINGLITMNGLITINGLITMNGLITIYLFERQSDTHEIDK